MRGNRVQLSIASSCGQLTVATLLAGDEITIGRRGDVLAPDDQLIGRQHCRLIQLQGNPAVVDEHSANGTWLDDLWLVPARPCPLTADRTHRLTLDFSPP